MTRARRAVFGAVNRMFVSSAGFSPSSLANLALWIEADDLTTLWQEVAGSTQVASDGQTVGKWDDKSGAAFNLTAAADDTTRATYNTDGTLKWVTFDGTNDILRRTADLGTYAAGAASIFAAVRANPAVNAKLMASASSTSNNPTYSLLDALSATASTRTQQIRDDANTTISVSGNTTSFFDNVDEVLGITDDGANLIPYINTIAQTTRTYTRAGTFTFDRFALGGWQRAAASNFFATRVYALVIVHRVITAQERADLITYLGTKAGLTL